MKKKKEKVRSKKRLLIKISILTAFVISFTVFALYFISEANKAPAQIEDKDAMYETRLMEIPDGATPSDYASNDVVAMLMWKLANTSEFKTVTTGTANASVATQLINNTRVVKNDKAIITTISSGFVKLGKQKYVTNDKVLIRDAVSVDGTNATFDNNSTPECITTKAYMQRYGWMPFQTTGYIICDETILNISTMTCENGIYHITMDLNPDGDYAPFWYRREVLSSSGSSIIPEFSQISIEYVFDNNFRILESNIKETYMVRSMGVSAETKTDCHEVFEYENIEFDKDTIKYFEGFKDLAPAEDSEEELDPTKKDIITMLVESLQNSDKSDSVFDLNIKYNNTEIKGVVALNITDLTNIKVIVNLNDIYVEYSDKIYIALGNNLKVCSSMDDILNLVAAIPLSSDGDASAALDVNAIMASINSGTIVEDDKYVTITTSLEIAGIKLPLIIKMEKIGDAYKLISISSNTSIGEDNISLSISSTNKQVLSLDKKEFSELSNLDFIIGHIGTIMTDKKLGLDVDAKYKDLSVKVEGDLSFDSDIKAKANVTLNYQELKLNMDLYYQNDAVFIHYNDSYIKLNIKDLMSILAEFGISMDSINTSSIDIEGIINQVLALDYSKLITKFELNDELKVDVCLDQLIKDFGIIMIRVKEDNGLDANISWNDLTVHANINEYQAYASIDEEKYSDIKNLITSVISAYKDIYKNSFNVSGNIDANLNDIALKAILDANIMYNEGYTVDADIKVNVSSVEVVLNVKVLDNAIYLTVFNNVVKVTFEEIEELIASLSKDTLEVSSVDMSSISNLLETIVIDSNGISVDLESLIGKSFVIAVLIAYNEALKVEATVSDIASANLTVKKIDYKEIKAPQNTINIMSFVNNVIGLVNTVLNNSFTVTGEITASIKDIDITASLDADIMYNDGYSVNADITINALDMDITLNVKFIDNVIYLSVFNNTIKVTLEELTKLVNDLSGDSEVSFDMSCLNGVLDTIILSENGLSVDLASLLGDSFVVAVELVYNEAFEINASVSTIASASLTITPATYEEIKAPTEYVEVIEFVNNTIALVNTVLNNSFTAKGVISATYNDINLDAKFNADVMYKDGYTVDANLSTEIKGINLDVNVKYIDNTVYLTVFNNTVKMTVSEIEELIAKLSGKEASLSFELSSVPTLLATLKLKNNGLSIDLEGLLGKSFVVALTLAYKEEFKINASVSDIATLDVSIKSIEYSDIKTPTNAVSINSFVNTVIDLVTVVLNDSFDVTGTISANYNDIEISANLDAYVAHKDNYEVDADISLEVKGVEITLNVKYVNDAIYLTAFNNTLKLNISDLEELINSLSSEDAQVSFELSSLNGILNTLVIKENGLSVNLEELLGKAFVVAIELVYNEGFNVNVKVSDIATANLVLNSVEYTEIVVPSKSVDMITFINNVLSIVNTILNKSFNVAGKADVSVSNIDVKASFDANIMYNDGYTVDANLEALVKDIKVNANVKYLNNAIYLTLFGNTVKLTISELEELINKISPDSSSIEFDFAKITPMLNTLVISENGLSIDLNELLGKSMVVALTIAVADDIKLGVNVSDIANVDLTLKSIDYKEIITPTNAVSINTFINNVLTLVDTVLYNSFNVSGNIEASISNIDIDAKLNANVMYKDAYSVDANIEVEVKGINVKANVKFIDNTIYLSLFDNTVKLTVEELMALVERLSGEKEALEFDLSSLSPMLETIVLKENGLSIDLNELLGKSFVVAITLAVNEDIRLDANISDIASANLTIKKIEYKEIETPTNVVSINQFVNDVITVVETVLNNSFNVSGTVSASVSDIDIEVSLSADIMYNEGYTVDANITASVKGINVKLNVKYVDEAIYLTVFGNTVKLIIEELEELVAKFSNEESTGFDLSTISPILETVVIKSNGLSIDLNELLGKSLVIAIELAVEDDINLNVIAGDIASAELAIKSIDYKTIEVPSNAVSINTFVNNVIDLVDTVLYNSFNVAGEINASVKDIDIAASLDANIMYNEGYSVDADIEVEVKGINVTLNVKYIDEAIYLTIFGNTVKLTIEELEGLIARFSNEESTGFDLATLSPMLETVVIKSNGLSIDLNALLGKSLVIAIEIACDDNISLDVVAGDIATADLTIKSIEYSKVVVPTEVVSINQFINDVITVVETVLNNSFNVTGTVNSSVKDIDIEAAINANVMYNEGYTVDANITASVKDINVSLNVKYVNDAIYLSVFGNTIKLTIEELEELIARFSGEESTNIDLSTISPMLETVVIKSNGLSIDLNELLGKSLVIAIELAVEDDINLNVIAGDIASAELTIKSIDYKAIAVPTNAVSINTFVNNVIDLVDTVLYNSFNVAGEINASVKDIDIAASLDADIMYNEGYSVDADITVEVKGINVTLNAKYVNDSVYITVYGNTLKMTISEIKELISKLSTKEVSFDLSSVSPILETIVIKSNGVSVDLASLLGEAFVVAIELAYNEEFNIKANVSNIATAELTINAIEYCEIAEPTEMVEINDFVNTVITTVNMVLNKSFNVSGTITASINDIDINASVDADIMYNDGYAVDADLSVEVMNINLSLNVKYINDSIYLTIFGNTVKMTISEMEELISSLSDGSSTIEMSKINPLLETIKISSNGLSVDLESLLNKSMVIALTLVLDEDVKVNATVSDIATIAMTIKTIEYSEIATPTDVVSINSFVKSVIEIVNTVLNKSFNVSGTISASVKDIDITATINADIMYSDTYTVDAKINANIKNNDIEVLVKVLNEKIYLTVFNNTLVMSFDDIKSLIAKSNKEESSNSNLDVADILDTIIIKEDGLSIDLVSLLKETFIVAVSIATNDKKILTASISNIANVSLELKTIEYKEITEPTDVVNISGLVNDVITVVNTVLNNSFNVTGEMSASVKDIDIEGSIDAKVMYNEGYTVDADIEVLVKGVNVKVNVKYINDSIYLTVFGNTVKLTIEELEALIARFNNGESSEFDYSKLSPMLSTIVIKSNGLSIDLNELLGKSLVIAIEIACNDAINVGVSVSDIATADLTIKSIDYSEVVVPTEVVSINEFVNDVITVVETVLNKSFNVTGTVNASVKDIDIEAGINADIMYNEGYTVDANITASVKDINVNLNVKYVDDAIYLSVFGNTVKLTVEELEELIARFTGDESTEFDFAKLNPMLSTIVIKSNGLSIDLNELLGKSLVIAITLAVEDDINLNVIAGDIASAELTVKSIEYSKVVAPTESIEISTFVNNVITVVETVLYNSFNVLADVEATVKDIDIIGTINANVMYNECYTVDATITAEVKGINVTLNVKYLNDSIYLTVFGNTVKLTVEEMKSLVARFSDEESNEFDFAKLNPVLSSIVLSTNGLSLDLDGLLEDSMVIALSLACDETISLDVVVGEIATAELTIKSIDYAEVVAPTESISINQFVNDVITVVETVLHNSFNLSGNVNASAKDIDVDATINANIMYNEGYTVDANITASVKGINVSLNVKYVDETIYLNLFGNTVKLTVEELKELVARFSSEETTEFDFTKLNPVLNSIVLKTDGLSIDLEGLLEDSMVIALNLACDDVISLDVVAGDIATAELEIKSIEYSEVVVPTNSIAINTFVNDVITVVETVLHNSFNVIADVEATVKDIDIVGTINANVMYNEGYTVYASISVEVKDINVTLTIKYVDDTIYLSLFGNTVKLTIEELEGLIARFNSDDSEGFDMTKINPVLETIVLSSNGLSVNLESLLEKSFVVALSIATTDDINVNAIVSDIATIDASITSIEYQAIIAPTECVSINTFVNDVIDLVETVLNNSFNVTADITASLNETDITGNINANIMYNEGYTVDANISVSVKDIDVSLNIKYVNDSIYLVVFGNTAKLSIADLEKLAEDLGTADVDSDKIETLLNTIIISENGLSIDLESLLEKALVVAINIATTNDIVANATISDIATVNAKLKSIDYEAIVEPTSFVDVYTLADNIKDLVNVVLKNSFTLTATINAKVEETLIEASVNASVMYNDGYSVNADILVELSSVTANVNIKYINDKIYLTISNQVIALSFDDIKEIVKRFTSNDEEDETNVNNILNTIVISSDGISVNLEELLNKSFVVALTIISGEKLEITASDIATVDVNIAKTEYSEISAPTPTLIYSDIDTILDLVDLVLDIKDSKDFNLSVDLDVYDDGVKHLNVVADIKLKLLEEKKFNAYINGTIYEYDDKGVIINTHKVELTIINDNLYIIYGNNPNEPNSKIKLYTPFDTIEHILEIVSELMGIDLSKIKELLNTVTYSENVISLDTLINSLSTGTNSISLSINEDEILNAPYAMDIDLSFDSEAKTVLASAKNIYVKYTRDDLCTMLDVNSVGLSIDKVEISEVTTDSSWYDISTIDNLVEGLVNLTKPDEISIKGEVQFTVLGLINIYVPVTVNVSLPDDIINDIDDLKLFADIDLSGLSWAESFLASKGHTYIYYSDGYVYIKRAQSDGNTYEIKTSLDSFMDNIVYYLLDFGMGLSEKIMNRIYSSKSDSTEDTVFVDAGKVINSYSATETKFSFNLSLEKLTANSNLGDLEATLNLGTVILGDTEINILKSISNVNVNLVSVIDIKTNEPLTVSNVDKDNKITNVSFEDFDSYVSDYKYNPDSIYLNGKFQKKINHSVTFVIGKGEENYVYYGSIGSNVVYPTIDLIEYEGQLYKLEGWYLDKAFENPYTETTVGESNVRVYAKYKVVYAHKLTIKYLDSTEEYDTYNTDRVSKYVNTDYVIKDGITYKYICLIDEFGNEYDNDSMPNSDLTLTVKYEALKYYLVVDNNMTTKQELSDSITLNSGNYQILSDDIYYSYKSTYLTNDFILSNYINLAVQNGEEYYIYIETENLNRSGCYTISLSYNETLVSDKLYHALTIKAGTIIDSSYLPSKKFTKNNSTYEINYWYTTTMDYTLDKINTITSTVTLEAYYSSCEAMYELKDNHASITGHSHTSEGVFTLILPKYAKINNTWYLVEEISDASFIGDESVEYLYLNEGLTTIGGAAFKNAYSLKAVWFGSTINTVATDAFYFESYKNEDNAKALKFYFNTLKELDITSWQAVRPNNYSKDVYYGKKQTIYNGWWFEFDFTSAKQSYSGSMNALNKAQFN